MDDLENLALACRSCNLFKSDWIEATDSISQMIAKLFHPRTDRWEEHFLVTEGGLITGLTAIGRVTVEQLRMNARAQVSARKVWLKLGIYG
ncbi:MAG: HNH endonuclease [Planctomycetaceae bacterium]|nr:HNH endonuclease [Planctomycetaceae bacterium]